MSSLSCKLEPAIWSRGTGQRIACFDRCQLIIAGMSNIKEVNRKLRLYVSFLEYGRHVGQLRRRRRRAYAPTSNTASQDNHEKIDSWVSFIFPLHDEYGAPLGGPSGRRSSANITIPAKCSAYFRRLSCGFPLHFVLCLELFSSSKLSQLMASNWRVCIFRVGEHEATPSVTAL